MTFKSFLNKIGSGIKSTAHMFGHAVSTVYHDVKHMVSGAGKGIEKVITGGQNVVNHIVQGTEHIAGKVVDTGGSVIKGAESAISTPLLLLAGGLGLGAIFLMKNSNAGQIASAIRP